MAVRGQLPVVSFRDKSSDWRFGIVAEFVRIRTPRRTSEVLRLRLLDFEILLGQFNDLFESIRIVDGHFGKRLAIEFHMGVVKSCDQFTVTNTVGSARSIHTGNPQSSKFSLAGLAITKRINSGTE